MQESPVLSAWVGGLLVRRGAGEVADLRPREIATDEAAEEVVARDHVDARLGRGVEAARETAEAGVEVGDLDRDVETNLARGLFVVAADVDLQIAVPARSARGH